MPVWNTASTLRDAIDSVLTQQGVSVELIVLDNESTDGSRAIISAFQPHIHHFISGKDKGVYDAMNRGIDTAQGTWFYFLGADDKLASPDSLQQVLACAEEDADLVIGNIAYTGNAAANTRTHYPPRFDQGLIWRNVVHHQACLYHRRCFATYRYPNEYRILGDYHLNLTLWLQGSVASFSQKTLAIFGAEGLSKNYTPTLYGEELRLKQELLSGWKRRIQPYWIQAKKWYKRLK